MTGEATKRAIWSTAATLFLVGLVLRLVGLNVKPFWIAEIQEFTYAHRGMLSKYWVFAAGDFIGFLYHKLCYTMGLEPTHTTVRALSVATGAALGPMVFLMLSNARLPVQATLAGVLTVLSLPLLQAAQEGRFYIGLTTFLTISLLADLFGQRGGRRAATIIVCDTLAMLTHPYAAVWIFMRLAFAAPFLRRDAWPTLRQASAYVAPVGLAAALQVAQIMAARSRFQLLHTYFELEAYPPDFPLLSELVGHMGAGLGMMAGLFGFLILAGLYSLSDNSVRQAARLAAYALGGPLFVVTAIWLAGGRFSFTHLLPAAVPLYVLAAFGLTHLGKISSGLRLPARVSLLMVPLCFVAGLAGNNYRYLVRDTRLEMGADIQAACSHLGRVAQDGDFVVTTYDKYFTALSFYCGPVLPDSVSITVPQRPDSNWVVAFNHLFPEDGKHLLDAGRVKDLSVLDSAPPDATVHVLVPYFETIEGQFSESIGWYGMGPVYGEPRGPSGELLAGWTVRELPLVKVISRPVGSPGDERTRLGAQIQTILAARRPMM